MKIAFVNVFVADFLYLLQLFVAILFLALVVLKFDFLVAGNTHR